MIELLWSKLAFLDLANVDELVDFSDLFCGLKMPPFSMTLGLIVSLKHQLQGVLHNIEVTNIFRLFLSNMKKIIGSSC